VILKLAKCHQKNKPAIAQVAAFALAPWTAQQQIEIPHIVTPPQWCHVTQHNDTQH